MNNFSIFDGTSEQPEDVKMPESLRLQPSDEILAIIKRTAARLNDERAFGHVVLNGSDVRIRADEILAELSPGYFQEFVLLNQYLARKNIFVSEYGHPYVITPRIRHHKKQQEALSDTIRDHTYGRLEAIFMKT